MEEKRLFHERYVLTRLLGRGNFSEVWLANDTKTKTNVALKVYAPATGLDDNGLDIFAREFSIVVNANHKNLLKPLHYDTYDRKPYLVLPYCKNGSAQKRVGIFKEHEIWKLLRDIASGLSFLHSMQPPVIHQDIKPDNIMVSDNGDYMLTDFGVSSYCRSVLRKTIGESLSSAGTMAYMGPERFGKNANVPIMASDIYSLGASAFELLTGDTPFGNDGGLVQKKGAEIPELPNSLSADLRKVINLCLNAEPWHRPTALELESYATKGLNGERVIIKGEKTLLRKLWPFLIVLLFGVGGLIAWEHHVQEKQEKETRDLQIQKKKEEIEILFQIENKICKGDSLYFLASIKEEENYEELLISSRKEYLSALNLIKGHNKEIEVTYFEQIQNRIAKTDSCLMDVCEELKKKATYFKDDTTIMREFELRVQNIENILN